MIGQLIARPLGYGGSIVVSRVANPLCAIISLSERIAEEWCITDENADTFATHFFAAIEQLASNGWDEPMELDWPFDMDMEGITITWEPEK